MEFKLYESDILLMAFPMCFLVQPRQKRRAIADGSNELITSSALDAAADKEFHGDAPVMPILAVGRSVPFYTHCQYHQIMAPVCCH